MQQFKAVFKKVLENDFCLLTLNTVHKFFTQLTSEGFHNNAVEKPW